MTIERPDMRRPATLVLLLVALARWAPAGEPAPVPVDPRPDLFAQVLRDAGVEPGTLGYRAKGTWNRFPDAPYKLPFFDDLLAEPTATYEFVRTLGNVVEDWLTPERLREADPKKASALVRLGMALGTDRRIGGFRGPFGDVARDPRLDAWPPEAEALVAAIESIYDWQHLVPAGSSDEPDAPSIRDLARSEVQKTMADVPGAARAPLARFVRHLAWARTWIERGLRDVPPETRAHLFGDLSHQFGDTDPDGHRELPGVDDVAKRLDEQSLHHGCRIALQAVQDLRREVAAATPAGGWPAFHASAATRLGRVVFESGPGSADTAPGDHLAWVRFTRVPKVSGPLGVTTPSQPLSVALLLDGADHVGGESAGPEGAGAGTGSLARGVLGCGILYVAGDSPTRYAGGAWTMGSGLFGMGILVDEGGDDTYESDAMAQGAGMFGVGLLLDAAGNDTYVLRKGDGQGFGGPNGIGVLADRSGNDSYYAEPDAKKAGRADYHSDHKVAVSNAQGVGSGRRGDLTDGHAWAGGLGALIDVDGNDRYRAGNFSQGCGYWFGTGAIYDGGGNDEYRSVYFTQASGAHFAVGAIVDEGGDDVHVLEENAGAGLGFGWDVVNAILHDRAGNDRYEAKIISVGCANVRSNGWLLDEGGDDVYVLDEGAVGFGGVDDRPAYATPDRYAPFAFHLPQLGLLVDGGGADRYLRRPKAGGDPAPDPQAKDGGAWGNGPRRAPGGPNVARGLDAAGRIGFLDAWPRRGP